MTTRSNRQTSAVNLPLDSYARRSQGFDGYEMNQAGQHKSNKAEITRVGRTVGKELSDGISAWSDEKSRGDWEAGIRRMEQGVSGGMAIWQADRFTRQTFELVTIFKRVKGMGCVLLAMGRAFEIDNYMDRSFLLNMIQQAEMSSDTTSFKVRDKFEWQREQGWFNYAGQRVFGHPGWEQGRSNRVSLDSEQVQAERTAVREGYRDILLGAVSLQELANRWNAAGLAGTRGKAFTNITVRQVLLRPLHAGLLVHKGEIVGKATNVEPIVDEETYQAAAALFSGRRRGRAKATTLCSGFIRCGECDHPLISRPKNGVPAYICAKQRGGCGKVVTFAEYMDKWMRELVVERLSDTTVAEGVGAALARVSAEAAELNEALARDRATMTRLGKDLAEGMAIELMQAAGPPINRRIKKAEARLAELAKVSDVEIKAEDRAAIESDWDDSDVPQRRELIRNALRGIHVVICPGPNKQYTPERMVEWCATRVAVIPQDSPLA